MREADSTKVGPLSGDLSWLMAPWQGMVLRQTRLWLEEQARRLDMLERLQGDWVQRRQADTVTALVMLDRMAATEDVGERADLCARWLDGVAGRVGEDMRSLGGWMVMPEAASPATDAGPDAVKARPPARSGAAKQVA